MEIERVLEPSRYRSETVGKLMMSLARAQGMYKPLKTNQEAPGCKFANLQAILDATRQALSENELAFYQYLELQDEGSGAALLISVLGHSSGEWISSRARVVMGNTDRATGNIYEIHKRFHALMLLGIAPSDGDPHAFDDNGTELNKEHVLEELKKPEGAKPKISDTEPVTKDQYDDLMIELNGYKEITKNIMDLYGIETLADLPRVRYHTVLQNIRHLKKTHDEYNRR